MNHSITGDGTKSPATPEHIPEHTKKGTVFIMSILAFILFGLFTTFVTACEGDFEMLKGLGTIILYAVIIIPILVFLAYTGWAGLILILVICFAIAGFSSLND